MGDLIATTYVLTIEDAYRFRRSRDAGYFVGLQPGRRNSGESEPQLHISKEVNEYLRTLLAPGAHYILGPFGEDSDLRQISRISQLMPDQYDARAVEPNTYMSGYPTNAEVAELCASLPKRLECWRDNWLREVFWNSVLTNSSGGRLLE